MVTKWALQQASISINMNDTFPIWKVLTSCFHSWNKYDFNICDKRIVKALDPPFWCNSNSRVTDDRNKRNHDNTIMFIKDESAHREKSQGRVSALLTLMVSNQSSERVWFSVKEADAHLLFDVHFFQYLGELAKGDAHVSISVSFLDGSVCNASKLLIRNIHAYHHSQHL